MNWKSPAQEYDYRHKEGQERPIVQEPSSLIKECPRLRPAGPYNTLIDVKIVRLINLTQEHERMSINEGAKEVGSTALDSQTCIKQSNED